MCGIAGILSANPSPDSAERLKKMTDALAHRGPDGAGNWVNASGCIFLGHRRLSILDLTEKAAQPMHFLGRYSIVHNGEIYNYVEIRQDLEKKGYSFQSQSDTEVILAAFDYYGKDCLSRFDGMFAFAIWDETSQTLFAARDRFGEKPLYYYCDSEQFLFASEIKAFWPAGISRSVNYSMLFNYLTLGYTGNPGNPQETFYTGVEQLPARHYLEYRPADSSLRIQSWWDIDIHSVQQSDDQTAIDTFRSLLMQSVARRLRSDVSVGTSLSGGVDSSSIAAFCREIGSDTFNHAAFTASFPGFDKDESSLAETVANRFELNWFTTYPTAGDLLKNFATLVYHQDEPFGSSSTYAQYCVFSLASDKGTRVLLDGQGADESLAGYNKYFHHYWQELYKKNRRLFDSEKAATLDLGIGEKWSIKNIMAALLPSYAAWYARISTRRRQRSQHGLNKDFVKEYGSSYYDLPHPDSLQEAMYFNMSLNGLGELLRYADRNSMAHGHEVRLPFLQFELVTYLFSLPSHFKIRNGRTKWLLRKTMEPLLPPEITWRKDKTGFEPPQYQWMNEPAIQDAIRFAKQKLVREKILKPGEESKNIQPHTAYAAEQNDWRNWVAGSWLP